MNWGKRIPARAPRRTTTPYPVRFVAVCGEHGMKYGLYDLHVVERYKEVHVELTGCESAEVVRAEEVGQ